MRAENLNGRFDVSSGAGIFGVRNQNFETSGANGIYIQMSSAQGERGVRNQTFVHTYVTGLSSVMGGTNGTMSYTGVRKEDAMEENDISNAKHAPKKEKKDHFSSKIVVASVIAIVGFTIGIFVLEFTNIENTTNVQLPVELIVSWFAFWTVEIVMLASITKSKIKNKYHDSDDKE